MRVHSLKSAFWVIFLAFAGLVVLASGATFFSLHAQKQDALVINLAGRQRMLLQQIGRQALRLSLLPDKTAFQQTRRVSNGSDQGLSDQHLAELMEANQLFDQTLVALMQGGETYSLDATPIVLPQTRDKTAQQLLADIQQEWQEVKSQIHKITTLQPGDPGLIAAVNQVQQLIPVLTNRSDLLATRYEHLAETKLNQLRLIQLAYLAATVMVIAWGIWLMRRKVLAPLQEIEYQAGMIAAGSLEQPLQAGGLSEIEQIGVTMETMRQEMLHWQESLEAKVNQRTLELEALAIVSQEITANLHLENVFQSITDKTRQLLGCEVAFLCLHEEDQDSLHLNSASCGQPVRQEDRLANSAAKSGGKTRPLFNPEQEDGILLPVLQRCEGFQCTSASSRITSTNTYPANQVLQGKLVDASRSHNGHSPHCQVLEARYQASHLAAPLVSGGQVFGALCAGSAQENFFNEEDQHLLKRLASVASLALQNARLYSQAERLAVLEERQQVAAEIHDGFIQTVNTIRLLQEQLEVLLSDTSKNSTKLSDILAHMRHASRQAEKEARKALSSLHEELPPAATLQDQLQNLVTEISIPNHPVKFVTRIHLPVMLEWQTTEQVLRIAREAIVNALKHARADLIQLNLDRRDKWLVLQVQDDGAGFPIGENVIADDRVHFGLQVMQARAQRIGAVLEIESQPGFGTRVRLLLPVKA